jgi:hypothetical protein
MSASCLPPSRSRRAAESGALRGMYFGSASGDHPPHNFGAGGRISPWRGTLARFSEENKVGLSFSRARSRRSPVTPGPATCVSWRHRRAAGGPGTPEISAADVNRALGTDGKSSAADPRAAACCWRRWSDRRAGALIRTQGRRRQRQGSAALGIARTLYNKLVGTASQWRPGDPGSHGPPTWGESPWDRPSSPAGRGAPPPGARRRRAPPR